VEQKLKLTEHKLSYNGTMLYVSPAPDAGTGKPTVIFTHSMWGNHRITARHVKLFNDLGYSCVTFDLYKSTSIRETLALNWKKPGRFLYQELIDQITDVQNSVPGPKIMFSLSGPSLCSLIASSSRTDIVAFICDGGPFKEIYTCTLRMFRQQTSVPTLPLQMLVTGVACAFWGLQSYAHLQKALAAWPKDRPILSLRGGKDPIVFPENIAHAFADQPQLPLTVGMIPEAGHLDGLKNFPGLYKKLVMSFLKE